MSDDPALTLLAGALPQLAASFHHLPPLTSETPAMEPMAAVLAQVAQRRADA